MARPNVLFFLADQFRADAVGAVGGWTHTKALDRLAAEGCLFSRAITDSPECVPARMSLATGLYPHQTGVWVNGMFTLNPRYPNWMRAIADAGYRTSLFGKTHLHPHQGDLRDRQDLMHAYGLHHVDEIAGPRASMEVGSHMTAGWQAKGLWEAYRTDLRERFSRKTPAARPSTLGLEEYYDVYVARRASEYLRGYRETAPWFCWISFAGPHEPWDTPEPYASLYDPHTMPLPVAFDVSDAGTGLTRDAFASLDKHPPLTIDDARRLRANYAGGVTLIDERIGEILDIVRARGELDDTLVVFTSDHGEMNGDHGLIYKSQFFAAALDIPLIVSPPAHCRARRGERLAGLAQLMDVGATIADYCGAPIDPSTQALSLRAQIEGASGAGRSYALSEYDGSFLVTDGRWKLELAADLRPTLLLDRDSDPEERTDVLARRGSDAVVARLIGWLKGVLAAATPPRMPVTV